MTIADARVLSALNNKGYSVNFKEESFYINDELNHWEELFEVELTHNNKVLSAEIRRSVNAKILELEKDVDEDHHEEIESLNRVLEII